MLFTQVRSILPAKIASAYDAQEHLEQVKICV